jgi:hypothetical protein
LTYPGTSDILAHAIFRTRNTPEGRQVIDEERLKKAWISCRKFFPLVGAHVVEGSDDISFVVDEARLSAAGPQNFEVLQRKDDSHVENIRESIINPEQYGKTRILGNECLAKLYIILSPPNDDQEWLTHDIIFASCHAISDAAGTLSIARAFFEFLAGPQDVEAEEELPTLEDRLGSVPAIEEVYPVKQQSRAASLWRWAIARVFYDLENARLQV